MNIGIQIRNRRKELGLTQEELAKKIGVTRTAVSNWESGRNYPDIELITLLSKEMDIPLYYLLADNSASGNQIFAGSEKERNKREKDRRRNLHIPCKFLLPVATALLFFALLKVTAYSDLSNPNYVKSVTLTEQGMLIQTDLPVFKSLVGYIANYDTEGSALEIALTEKTDFTLKNNNELTIAYSDLGDNQIASVEIYDGDEIIKSFPVESYAQKQQ